MVSGTHCSAVWSPRISISKNVKEVINPCSEACRKGCWKLFFGPSSFDYPRYLDNLLWLAVCMHEAQKT